MKCLACGADLPPAKGWEHIRAVHLAPLGVTPEKILNYACHVALPLKVKLAPLTCIKLPEKIIYFSLDNAALLIAYAAEKGGVPWTDVVAWQILHEKGHLTLRGLYEPPEGVRPEVVVNVEDYYINRYLVPGEYWPVCRLNARCAVVIRSLVPVPAGRRDAYFYLTLGTFLAYEAVTVDELTFLTGREAEWVTDCAAQFVKIREVEDLALVGRELERMATHLVGKS